MLRTIRPHKQLIRKYVELFFAMDEDFVRKYHARAGEPFDVCVQYDMDQITEDGSEFHVIMDGSTPAACFCWNRGFGHTALCFFFISPMYRKKALIKEIWQCVLDGNGNEPFVVGIRERNAPARKFYERAGGTRVDKLEDPRNAGQMVDIYTFGGVKWPLQLSQ